MKIVQIVNSLDIGGLERLAIDLAEIQQKHRHKTVLYCLSHAGTMAREAAAAGIPVKVFGKKRGISPRTFLRMRAELKQDQPDVVHTHNAVVHHYGALAARSARVPVVVNTRHGLGTLHSDPRQDKIFRATLPWTDTVIMVSDSTRVFFAKHKGIPFTKSSVILNGIPVEKFSARPAHPGTCEPVVRFGTVGRLVPAKDHATLIRAFRLVLKDLPQAQLSIIGDGSMRTELNALVKELELQHHVSLLGPTLDIGGALSSLDIFVLSSVTEGLPVAILEAMAAGLPIVSTRVAGIPQVAPEGKVAMYCEPSEPDALAAAMVQMAKDRELATKGMLAREYAEKHFSIAQMWRQYELLFARLLEARERPLSRG